MKQIVVLSSCFALFLVFFSCAVMASGLECVEKSKGKILQWSGRWNAGNSLDDGVEYRIEQVEVHNKMPLRFVSLQLVALGEARTKERRVSIETEEKARSVCDRIYADSRNFQEKERRNSDSMSFLPFIYYSKDGWVRSRSPSDNQDLTTCRVFSKEYACPIADKEKYGEALMQIEEELRWAGR